MISIVIKRDGSSAVFNAVKIEVAIKKAFVATNTEYSEELIKHLMRYVTEHLSRQDVEHIQDMVEQALMANGYYEVARNYILYRNNKAKKRSSTTQEDVGATAPEYIGGLLNTLTDPNTDIEPILSEVGRSLTKNPTNHQIIDCAILATRTLIEKDPSYSFLAARLLRHKLFMEVFGDDVVGLDGGDVYKHLYRSGFKDYIWNNSLHKSGLLDQRLNSNADFDLDRLKEAIDGDRDLQFDYLGMQTLYDRYFLHDGGRKVELPQWLFMRVAMGLALNERSWERTEKAIEFYDLLSQFYFMSSTPTLFNSGRVRPQLSSCYLTTIEDSIEGIYEGMKENAHLSKYAGGLGNDWTNVRALGAWIKGTNGKSQGVIPFMKVANDTAVAVNQGGLRKGAACAYLETWHLDIEEFLELRKNTGDDRRRCHDMNSANWIPDLFMERVFEGGVWTLFTPSDVPDLHDLYGSEFRKRYEHYEGEVGKSIKLFKQIPAVDLWRKMLSMLFETGHPWITFKDPCNLRNPQQHVGVVHSSNLCTEITLNTDEEEIAVCNLGSVNLVKHLLPDGSIDRERLAKTVRVAMRMLDNVIDINFYPVEKARKSNLRHRPVGLGLMGFQDCLHIKGVAYDSVEALDFADTSTELLCYYAYEASSDLAAQRGVYDTYVDSLWYRGITPFYSTNLLAKTRKPEHLVVDKSMQLDWKTLTEKIRKNGMRNSNCVAIAPTATISNIVGVSASIEPAYQNLYVKSNLSGEFTVINKYLVDALKQLGLWDDVMVKDLKYNDGSVQSINRIPPYLRKIYKTAFEIEPTTLVHAASRRQKWIDQAQSLNIYVKGASGQKLDEIYKLAWVLGLKTTYYLRTMGATHAEKSTLETKTLNAVDVDSPACYLRPGDEGFEECEACQ